ncbi:hypothetical protein LEP1GSC061_2647 [Leptospira wolffii serovar Khorat str. Khorat-H2]|nr:hypothetical protein LEP1GSC061_2647 [Leptospira wolffii serovar Khorat str. Khorat-H2]
MAWARNSFFPFFQAPNAVHKERPSHWSGLKEIERKSIIVIVAFPGK